MKKIIVILILNIYSLGLLKAQKLTYASVNQLTYSQYQHKDWQNLIKTAKKSLKQGLDFYYLRNRLGIAYFESGKYGLAIPEFQKSLAMYKDDYILKSLYYSYLYAGRLTDAYSLSQQFPDDIKEELALKHKLQSVESSLFIENMQYAALQVEDINGTENLTGIQELTKSRFSPEISLSYAKKNGRSIFSFNFLHSSNIYRLQLETQKTKNFDTYLNQFRFYHYRSFRLNNSLNINYSFNLIPLVGQYFEVQSTNGNSMAQNQSYLATNYNYFDGQIAGGFTYKSVYYKINVDAAISRFSSSTFSQIEILPEFYPLANLNLYFSPKIILPLNKPTVYGMNLGIKVFSKLWLQVNYLAGNNTYFSSDFGNFVYNASEKINNSSTLSLIFPLKKVELTLSYALENKETPYFYSLNSTQFVAKYLPESAHLFYISVKF